MSNGVLGVSFPCVQCGLVEVPATQVVIKENLTTNDRWIEYACPFCSQSGRWTVDPSTLTRLKDADAQVIRFKCPTEFAERKPSSTMDALDVIDFPDELATVDIMARIRETAIDRTLLEL